MWIKKVSVLGWIFSFLLAACQSNQIPVPQETPGAYPYPTPGEIPAIQETVYPAPGDFPVDQATAYPYPMPGGGGAGSASEQTYDPQPGDEKLEKGNVFPNLEESAILLLDTYPVQVKLVLHGDLPTPCNQLRIKLSQPDAENRIQVEVYSVVDPNMMCVQVIQSFEAQVSLGSYASGNYTVYINGEYLGEFKI